VEIFLGEIGSGPAEKQACPLHFSAAYTF